MIRKVINYIKGAGVFSTGVFIGVIYGSIVSTLTCVAVLGLP